MSESCVIIIPARFGSTRLPGKPLVDIGGKPMIQHVVERANQVPNINAVVVATDDDRVAKEVRKFGGVAVMTSPDHPSGTDRMVELLEDFKAEIYINLQGDEPLVCPEDINCLVEGMRREIDVEVGTLCHRIDSDEAQKSNVVKVVLSGTGNAMYFSRSPIPYARDNKQVRYLRHVGMYAYRRKVLAEYSSLHQPMEEKAEMLEQLRLLHSDVRIRAWEVKPSAPGVDTPECLERVRRIIEMKL
jgi:3-deoxy-manno-octulosonate cytidylyltransferase (CMP-KDO synthetase)